ncbi:MAG: IPT/TIG domain-containing protein [Bdellovibrionales bacterium]|nr:IPT/TIG domain-containing protein [Bdellovibrionales bacterium]
MASKQYFVRPGLRLQKLVSFIAVAVIHLLTARLAMADAYIGVWNGFNSQTNIVEAANTGDTELRLRLVLYTSGGAELGREDFALEPKATAHLLLNKFQITDSYGTYRIDAAPGEKSSDLRLHGFTAFYRLAAPGAAKPLEYAFAVPFLTPLSRETSGIYNSYNPSGGTAPVYNWLTVIAMPDGAPFSGRVILYDQSGALIPGRSVAIENLPPGGRIDLPLGHEYGQVVGMYRIVPEHANSTYTAFLSRYAATLDGSYRYALSLMSSEGSCDPGPIPASTMDPATNWGEIANPGPEPLAVHIEVRDQSSQLLRSEVRTLAAFSQHHLYLNGDLGTRAVGSFRVRCVESRPDRALLVQSMFYGHRSETVTPEIEWSYASQALPRPASPKTPMTSLFNTYFSAFNWLKVLNPAPTPSAFQLEVYSSIGRLVSSSSATLGAEFGTKDIAIHESTGPNSVGLLRHFGNGVTAPQAELIRVFPRTDSGIGYIMNVPVATTAALGLSSSSSGGSSSGSSSSSGGSSSTSSGSSSGGTALALSPDSFDFGRIEHSERSTALRINVTNQGAAPVLIQGINISGDRCYFFVDVDLPVELVPGQSVILAVHFVPSDEGAHRASLELMTSDGPTGALLELSGVGEPRPMPLPDPIRVNAGEAFYLDAHGILWQSDQSYAQGSGSFFTTTAAIAGTELDPLYQSERFAKNLTYVVPLGNGTYDIKLHFAEIYWTAVGKRLLDVFLEGNKVLDNLDIIAEAGAATALSYTFAVEVTDGSLSLQLLADPSSLDKQAKLSAFEIYPRAVPLEARISGAQQVVDTDGDGSHAVQLDGSGSRAQGASIVDYRWSEAGGGLLSTGPTLNLPFPVGTYQIMLTVTDDRTPAQTDSETVTVAVLPADGVPAPIVFQPAIVASNVVNDDFGGGPTQAAWGPDGRLYVVSAFAGGELVAYSFDENYQVTGVQRSYALASVENNHALGIAFNPFDPPGVPRAYVSHSQLFRDGGSCLTGAEYPYVGQVSYLEGPTYATVHPVVTGLPVSNHDHGVNGLQFDNFGDLWIANGGNTNAGVESCAIGELPESPLSGAVLRAALSKQGFNCAVTYRDTIGGARNADQRFGDRVDIAPGIDVSVHTAGLRNPYDLVWTTRHLLYGTDNGPNKNYGPASTSATTQGSADPTFPDKVVIHSEGQYYGHPNRNRGRASSESRQNVFHNAYEPPLLGTFGAPIDIVGASSNGIDEYRATTFNNAMRGNLLVQQWHGVLYNLQLGADGRTVKTHTILADNPDAGLDVLAGPGGAILLIDYSKNKIRVLTPVDSAAQNKVTAYDIFPWRAPADGKTSFVIGGANFGTLADTTVTIGTQTATLTSVSSKRIKGVLPLSANPTAALLDVHVQSAGTTTGIPKAFRYLLKPGEGKGVWTSGAKLPNGLGSTAGGVINSVLYLIGDGSSKTYAYDIVTNQWHHDRAQRNFLGHSHAAEVLDGKLYLIGGIGGNAEGQVQIYNPVSDSWSVGAPLPFAAGALASAAINGKIYVAGGVVGGGVSAQAAVYNPKAGSLGSWSVIAPMPLNPTQPGAGRSHAASGSDGNKFYIFGGRGPGGSGSSIEDYADTYAYNPVTDMWETSFSPGTSLQPLPQKRSGMGKAPFYRNELYIIGGETSAAGSTTIVHTKVDAFSPVSKEWRSETALSIGRHGIFPLSHDGKLYVAAGGTQAGPKSNLLEVFTR